MGQGRESLLEAALLALGDGVRGLGLSPHLAQIEEMRRRRCLLVKIRVPPLGDKLLRRHRLIHPAASHRGPRVRGFVQRSTPPHIFVRRVAVPHRSGWVRGAGYSFFVTCSSQNVNAFSNNSARLYLPLSVSTSNLLCGNVDLNSNIEMTSPLSSHILHLY